MSRHLEEITTKHILISFLTLSPSIIITILLSLASLGVLPGDSANPLVVLVPLLFILALSIFGYYKLSNIVVIKSGKIFIPGVYFIGHLNNEYLFNTTPRVRRIYPVFCINLDNVSDALITKDTSRSEHKCAVYYSNNPEKTVCVVLKSPLRLHKGLHGLKYNIKDIPINRVYVSVANPNKLVNEIRSKTKKKT